MQIINIDILILVIGVIILTQIKRRVPGMFFLTPGVNIFLPPQQQKNQPNKKRKPKTKQFAVKFISAEHSQLKNYPLHDQYEKVFMLTLLLVFHSIITSILNLLTFLPSFFRTFTSLPFLLTFLLLLYALRYAFKISTHNGYRSYQFKAAILITLVLMALLAFSRLLLDNYLSKTLDYAVHAQSRHLNIILAGMFQHLLELTPYRVFLLLLFACGFMVLLNIPSIMKYGNAYTQMLQQAYGQNQQNPPVRRSQEDRIAYEKLKLSCQKQLKLYNIELILWATLLILWGIPLIREQISDPLMFWTRLCILGLLTYLSIINFSHQIELHLANAYSHIKKLQGDQQKTQQFIKEVQRKVYSYIYLFWYPSYQLMLRFVVPVLLFVMLIQKQYHSPQPSSYQAANIHYEINTLQGHSNKINIQTNCGLIKDPVLTLKQLYKCPANLNLYFQQSGLNGWQLTLTDNSVRGISNKIGNYGLLTKAFEVQIIEQLMWYYLLSRFIITVLYILFLRKTVLQI